MNNLQKIITLIGFSVTISSGATSQLPTDQRDVLDRQSTVTALSNKLLMTTVVRAGNSLVAAGERGAVLLSKDQGKTWVQSAGVPVSVTITRLFFLDADTGWAVGHSGVVLATQDGGQHWKKQLDGQIIAELELHSVESQQTGSRRVTRAERMLKEGADKPLLGVHFRDKNHGIVVGAYGIALETENGGISWNSISDLIDDPSERHLYDIRIVGDKIYICGEQGAIYRSNLGTTEYVELTPPEQATLFGMVFSESRAIIAFGIMGTAVRSTDFGESWELIDVGKSTISTGVVAENGDILLSNDTGNVFISSNDGLTFTEHKQTAGSIPTSSIALVGEDKIVFAGSRNLVLETMNDGVRK